MAGILERFSSIIKSNINALLDKAEDPAKMIDQYLRDLREDLAEVKRETAGVMAEEARAKRLLDENDAAIAKYMNLAKKALAAGNEGDAKTFLAKKVELESRTAALQGTYAVAKGNADKMRQMHDKLVADIMALESRKQTAQAKIAVARAQARMNGIYDASTRAGGRMEAFERMEARADQMLDQAAAMAELNAAPPDEAADLEKKYASGVVSGAVDEELEKLKAELGI